MANREFRISLTPDKHLTDGGTDYFLSGVPIKLHVVIFQNGKKLKMWPQSATKKITFESGAFDGGPVTLSLKNDKSLEVPLSPTYEGPLEIQASDYTPDAKNKAYDLKWETGFTPGTGPKGTATAEVRKPRVKIELESRPNTGMDSFLPAQSVNIRITPDRPPTQDLDFTIGGSALGSSQTLTYPKNKSSKSFLIEKLADTAVPGGKIEITDFPGYDFQAAGSVDVPIKIWTLAFDGPPASASSEDHGGLFFLGDTPTFKVKVSETPTVEEAVKILIYRADEKTLLSEATFTIPANDPPEKEVSVQLKIPGKEEIHQDETLTARLISTSGNCLGEKAEDRQPLQFTLSAWPTVRFHPDNPVVDRTPYTPAENETIGWDSSKAKKEGLPFYRLYAKGKHQIKLKRSKNVKLESKITVQGRYLKNPVEVTIPADQDEGTAEIEFNVAEQVKNVNMLWLAPQSSDRCYLDNSERTAVNLYLLPSVDYLYIEDGWFVPELPEDFKCCCAPGDQIWIKLSRDGEMDFKTYTSIDGGNAFATLQCDAFEPKPQGSTPMQYEVVFKPNQKTSELVSAKYPPDPKKGGIRIKSDASPGVYPITIVPTDTKIKDNPAQWSTAEVKGPQPKITVRKRFAYFSSIHPIDDVLPGATDVPLTVNLAHPARTDTAVLVKSPFSGKQHKLVYEVGQHTLSFTINFDIRPPIDQTLKVLVEPFSGNIAITKTGTDSDEAVKDYPSWIEHKKNPIYVFFDKATPILDVPYKTQVRGYWYPTYTAGSTVKLNVVLSEPAWADKNVAHISSTAFDFKDDKYGFTVGNRIYDPVFAKGESAKTVEVKLTNRMEGIHSIRVIPGDKQFELDDRGALILEKGVFYKGTDVPETLSYAVEGENRVEIRVLPLPQASFGNHNDQTQHWIETVPDLPFVVGEKAKVWVRLDRKNDTGGPLKGMIVSPVIKGDPKKGVPGFEIPAGEFGPAGPVEVEFSKEDKKVAKTYFEINRQVPHWGDFPIRVLSVPDANGKLGFASGPDGLKTIEVYEKRFVFFDHYSPFSPPGPFVQNESATVRINLDHAAPTGGASVELHGPFELKEYQPYPNEVAPTPTGGNKVEFPEGREYREVKVKFTGDSEAKDNVSLKNPTGCTLTKNKALTVRVKTPELVFDQETWDQYSEARKTLTPGSYIQLPFRLEQLCPHSGCHFMAECEGDLFAEHDYKGAKTRKYRVDFSPRQNQDDKCYTSIDIPIDPQKTIGNTAIEKKITLSDAKRCKLPTPAEIKAMAADPPRLFFEETGDVKYVANQTPELKSGGHYDVGDKTSLTVKPNRKVPEDADIQVRLKSYVFGSAIYAVTIPKGTDEGVAVEVTFMNGHSSLKKRHIYILPPEGWAAGDLNSRLKVQVKRPNTPLVTQPCQDPAVDTELAERERRIQDKQQQMTTYPDEGYCNLRRLLVTVKHGDHAKTPCTRGPFGDGRFEVVRDTGAAEKENPLVCDRTKAPVIQAIADHPSGDPHVKDPETSPHATRITVGIDPDGDFCPTKIMIHDKAHLHPLIYIADRTLKADWFKRRDPMATAISDSSHGSLLTPAPDPATDPQSSLVRRTLPDRYQWSPLVPKPAVNIASPDALMELPVHRAHLYWDESVSSQPSPDSAKTGMKTNILKDVFTAIMAGFKVEPHQYLIEAQTCGLPDPGATPVYSPAKNLRVIVETYPADEYCFYIGTNKDASVMESYQDGKLVASAGIDVGSEALKKSNQGIDYDVNKGFQLEKLIRSVDEVQAGAQDEVEDAFVIDPAKIGPRDEAPDDLDPPPSGGQTAPQTAPNPGPSGQPAQSLTSNLNALQAGADKEYKFTVKPFEPPSRVRYPYDGADNQQDVSYNVLNESGAIGDAPESFDPKNSALDGVISSGVMGKIADLQIHIGRNGRATDPAVNNGVRKALNVVATIASQIADMLNKSGDPGGAAWGYGFSGQLVFLKGHYVRYWGWKEAADHRVFWWNHNCIDMTLIGVEFEFLLGFSYGFVGKKIEAVLFAKIAGKLDIFREFEQDEPWKEKSAHVEKWTDVNTEARVGARIVLGDPSWFQIEAAIRTGYTFRFRTETRFGVDLEGYFNGLSAYLEATALFVFSAKVEYTFIKGNVAGWPQWSITLGGKGERKLAYVYRTVEQAKSRIRFIRYKLGGRFEMYQKLQLNMVADRKIKGGQQYPLTNLIPGYRFEPGGFFASEKDWAKNKRKWDAQWEACRSKFDLEEKSVPTRHIRLGKRSFPLKDRLARKTDKIENILGSAIIPKLEALDRIADDIERLEEDAQGAKDRYGEDNIPDYLAENYLDRAKRLRDHDALSYRKIKGDSRWGDKVGELHDQIQGLHYYALMREHW